MCNFLIRKLKEKISGEACPVAPHGLIESLGRHAVEPREIGVQYYALSSDNENASGDLGQRIGNVLVHTQR